MASLLKKYYFMISYFLVALGAIPHAQVPDPAPILDGLARNYYMPTITAAFGTFTYEQSDLPTPFARWLEDRLLGSASSLQRIQLVDKKAAAAMDPAFQALYADFFKQTGTQGLLYGRYFIDGDTVRVELRLSDLSMATLVGSADWIIPQKAIPASVSIKPSSTELGRAQELARLGVATNGGLTVSVSTDRGSGAAYRDGEKLKVMVTVNKDAFVRLYHVDAAGFIQLIWPNPWDGGNGLLKAGQTASLPPSGEPFVFLLQPPYGLEFLKAVASTRPFADSQDAFAPLGADFKNVATRGLSVTRPGQERPETAEAMASYYIGP